MLLLICLSAFGQSAAYPDVLNIHGVPDSANDRRPFAFFDRGAWQGYALPEEADPYVWGGFPVYNLMDENGYWLSRSLARLVFSADRSDVNRIGGNLTLSSYESNYFPDRLVQQYHFQEQELQMQVELSFLSDRTALVRSRVTNTAEKSVHLVGYWQGSVFQEKARWQLMEENGLRLKFEKKQQYGALLFSEKTRIRIDGEKYNAAFSINLDPGETAEYCHAEILCFDEQELKTQIKLAQKAFENPERVFADNRRRWDEMLALALNGIPDPARRQLAVKCVETLLNNTRSPAGELRHAGLFPSWNYRGFHGFWAWDSWKHAAALARFAPELAKDQMRAMFDFQAENGMVPDCVFRDTFIEKHNWRDTKPPLASWAVWQICQQTQDLDFLREMFPKLEKYHRWWFEFRDHDGNGRCEYGSTDGTLVAAKWESGMDNAVRFDSAQLLQQAEGLLNSQQPIRENYNPLTGAGLEANHFSWSAACLLLLLWGEEGD